jgi:hypothetical protein
MEITEDIYILKTNGKEIENFESVDILIKQVFCCYKSKRSRILEKSIAQGKKKLNVWLDIRR